MAEPAPFTDFASTVQSGEPAESITPITETPDPISAFAIEPPSEDTPTEEPSQSWQIQIDPTTVVAIAPDGRPITASEVEKGYLRQDDYTRKTQTIAESQKRMAEYESFFESNRTILEDLDSNDPDRVTRALDAIAQARGVELGKRTSNRDASGRFAKAESFEPIDLDKFEEGSVGWQMAREINALRGERASQDSELANKVAHLEGILGGLGTAIEQQQTQSQLAEIAEKWATTQFKDVDTHGAAALVGKPMTADQAMRIHHFDKIIRHLVGVSKQNGQPFQAGAIEPPSGGIGMGPDPSTTGLSEFISRRLGMTR